MKTRISFLALIAAFALVSRASSLTENVAAVESCRVAITNAIVAKGGTASGALTNAAAEIAALPGGGGEAGNGLPFGCPRIDKISLSGMVMYYVVDATSVNDFTIFYDGFRGECRVVNVSNDGIVTKTDVIVPFFTTTTITGGGYVVFEFTAQSRQSSCSVRISTSGTIASAVRANDVSARFSFSTGAFPRWVRLEGNQTITAFDGPTRSLIQYFVCNHTVYDLSLWNDYYSVPYAKINTIITKSNCPGKLPTTIYLDMSGSDISGASNLNEFIIYASNLVYLSMPSQDKGPRVSFSLSSATSLNHDSLLSVLNSLYDHISASTGSTPVLTLGATNLSKLAEDEKAIATDKGWTLQ